MNFLKQIKFEIKNILRSKFILIIGILVLVASIAPPVITFFTQRASQNMGYYRGGGMVREMIYGGYGYYPGDTTDQEPIVIDGVTIQPDSPFFWRIRDLNGEKEYMEMDKGSFSDAKIMDLVISMIDEEIKFNLHFVKHIDKNTDYRIDLSWTATSIIYDKFIYENNDVPEEQLLEAIGYRMGMDPETFKEKYINITPEARLAAIDKADESLQAVLKVVENNDFPQYIQLRIDQENRNIEDIKEQIAIQEELIIKNPSQEEGLNDYIKDMKKNITMVETSTIPMLQYRLDNNVIPGEDTWQNNALINIENYRNQLIYDEIRSEEEFSKDSWLVQEHKTYGKYVSVMQSQIDSYNNEILIAERSLDANKPDMKYVSNGARSQTVGFLQYSIFVAMFAVLVGGWLMASEFNQGTIRLLMIRPKTRTKILMAKFLGAFIISIAIYMAGSLLNIIANGAFFGFSDYAYPNYTISGEIGFLAYYLPKLMACTIPIIFGFTAAFMLSVLTKNVAVSIIIPIVGFIGSTLVMNIFASRGRAVNWLAYTPIPFVQMPFFFVEHSTIKYAIERGFPLSLPYGIMLMLVLSIGCAMISIFSFKRRDITN